MPDAPAPTNPPSAWHRAGLRGGLAVLLLVAYVGVWGDTARIAYVDHIARPVLSAAGAEAPSYTVHLRPAARTLSVTDASGQPVAQQHAPAGVPFLLPALFLVLWAPMRRYWIGLWGAHIALAILGLLALAAGLALHDAAFLIQRFLSAYVVDVVSIGCATLAVVRERGDALLSVRAP